MGVGDLSRAQLLVRRVVSPERFAAIEAESREWLIEGSCGHATDVWSSGGIRYRARGTKHTIRRCPTCGRSHRFTVHRRV